MKRSGITSMKQTVTHCSTVIIGAGQAGLAMSACLSARAIDHVILERGEVANSWRTERWDSLRLLSPNWQNQLPGYAYQGPDPDGYMSTAEISHFLDDYAKTIRAPLRCGVTVQSVSRQAEQYRIESNLGTWLCRALVICTGVNNKAVVPPFAQDVPSGVETLTTHQYRNPDQLKAGGVLVVGGAASGLQLAEEIRQAGHAVTLSVGEHVRAPRLYRGKDILWWMDALGLLAEQYDTVEDLQRARRLPSLQLVGSEEKRTLDLNRLQAMGVKVVGKLAGIRQGRAQFSGALANVCKLADLKMNRLLDTIDEWVDGQSEVSIEQPPQRYPATYVDKAAPLSLDLSTGDIRTIVWAVGYRPDYSWLDLPVVDKKGQLIHDGGVLPLPGLYAMGLPFMRQRKSIFIGGVGQDAECLSGHLANYLSASGDNDIRATG